MAVCSEKEDFLEEFGQDYGYPNAPRNIDQIRATEFKRLDGVVHLDHAGATLYSESQMEAILKQLNSTVYGNPHSQSSCSMSSSDCVQKARQQVLDFFNASPREYSCIFTSGATAALKLVGETFPWCNQSSFMYTMENHNSVLGIREKGAAAFAIDVEDTDSNVNSQSHQSAFKISHSPVQRRSEAGMLKEESTGNIYNLFAFPSECNFSGKKFNLDLVNIVKEDSETILDSSLSQRGHWLVLIDAAKGCATDPPDLTKYKADFLVISFYKMFGYPTGLGALIVKNGTVAAAIADMDFYKRRAGVEEFFEDGTVSFLSIASIHHGFRVLNTLTMSSVSRHTASLATYVRKTLLALRHKNGEHVCTIYGVNTPEILPGKVGPIVSFNLKRSDGTWYGYREVEKLASLAGIQLRTGCFCNPGACAKYLGLSRADLLSNIEAGHVCWDDQDILNGKPTGAVRISFGYMSTFEDARRFIDFIERSFVSFPSNGCALRARSAPPLIKGTEKTTPLYSLKSITIYPIKSCTGFSADHWPLTSTGLLHDREWLLRSASGEILTQKKIPEMCNIKTLVDLKLGILFVESPRCKEKLQIKLKPNMSVGMRDEIDIHAQRHEVQSYGNEVNSWFSDAVGQSCTLLRNSCAVSYTCSKGISNTGICKDVDAKLNFVNEAQLLLVSEESVADLNNRLRSSTQKGSYGERTEVSTMRFRPNLVISGGEPYAEDGWKSLEIGGKYFTSFGGCNRCQLINIYLQGDKVQRSNEPLATLAAYRRVKGKILFGILLRYEKSVDKDSDAWVHVGEQIFPNGYSH
nr:molybdenum cofactor sulfurase [Ipomoea trifida]